MNTLSNISPLDGRYANSIAELSKYFSESALMGYRLKVEIEYLIALSNEKSINDLPPFSKDEQGKNLVFRDFLSGTRAIAENLSKLQFGWCRKS